MADFRVGSIDDEAPFSKSETAAATNKKDEGMDESMYPKPVHGLRPNS